MQRVNHPIGWRNWDADGRSYSAMAVNDVTLEVENPARRDTGSWRAESICRKYPTRMWFGGDHRETVRAKAICAACVVQSECLEFAVGRADLLGIWAGTTPHERAAMRRAGDIPATDTDIGVEDDVAVDVDEVSVVLREVEVPAEVDVPVEEPRETEVRVDIDLVLETERDLEQERDSEPVIARGRDSIRALTDGDELFTPAEAARRLGVTPNTVTRWSRAGKISAIQTMGGHRRFRRSEIERVAYEANFGTAASLLAGVHLVGRR
jgi:excisionase family DNA binding protein